MVAVCCQAKRALVAHAPNTCQVRMQWRPEGYPTL